MRRQCEAGGGQDAVARGQGPRRGAHATDLLQYADLAQPEMRALREPVGTLNV